MTAPARIFAIEIKGERLHVLQHVHVLDEATILIEFTQAMFGWNVRSITRFGSNDWPNMTRDQIVAWKYANSWVHGQQVRELQGEDYQHALDTIDRYEAKLRRLAAEA